MNKKIFITILHDFLIFCLSFFIALLLRLDWNQSLYLMNELWSFCLLYAAANIFLLHYFGLYHGIWRYASMHEIISIFKSITISTLIIILSFFLIFRLENIPRSFPILLFIVSLFGVTGPRIFYRFLKDRITKDVIKRVPVFVVGDSNSSESFIRLTKNQKNSPYNVIGIISDKPSSTGRRIHNVPILTSIADIDLFDSNFGKKNKLTPQKIIITDQSIKPESVEKLYVFAQKNGLALGVLPKLSNINSKDTFATNPIAIEDVLGRKQKVHNPELLKDISNKVIMVTGAGGSIGSEICRQVTLLKPKRLILIEENEFALYKILKNLKGNLSPILADIRDSQKIDSIIKNYKPDIIFHAAALKHITFVEDDPIEALKTNFLATFRLCEICKSQNVPKLIFISTDKAVNPSNIMGASKRLCEKYIQNISLSSNFTKFSIVRFGNVLGSTGSVVPLFQEQIKQGGPITITDPKVSRYFMTIREAVELVLISSQLETKEGEIFILEMGKPILIKDLAKTMVNLLGQKENEIKIIYTGLRKGEKLSEQLFFNEEKITNTSVEGILSTTDKIYNVDTTDYNILVSYIQKNEVKKAIEKFKKMLPEYKVDVKNKY
jgi:O-antigen biosynthesis protein WbqV